MAKEMVVLSTFGVYPCSYGGQVRIFNLYRELSKYAKITIISYEVFDRDFYSYQITENMNLLCFRQSYSDFKMLRKASAKTGLFMHDVLCSREYKFTQEFIDETNKYCSQADIVVASHPYLMKVALAAKSEKIVYESHNFEYQLKQRYYLSSKNINMSNTFLTDVNDVEALAYQKSDVTISVDKEEDTTARSYYHKAEPSLIVENGINNEYYQPLTYKKRQLQRNKASITENSAVAFLGSGYFANIHALEFIITKVAAVLKDTAFIIIGSVKQGLKIQHVKVPDNVYLFGYIEESHKRQLLQMSDLAINPISDGAGTSTKISEYLAAGLPILATEIGARGFESESDCIFLASLEDFSVQLKRMLSDIAMLEKAAKRSRQLADEKYSWPILAARMKEKLAL